jgi:signal transduction histidine kinase
MTTHRHHDSFNADAAIVWRLGAELFTDSIQALLELVKNSYDADATKVRVEIERPINTPPNGHFGGRITITDDGHGMTEEAIRAGWLVLSASPKREQKAQGILTDKYHRMPLGDKGLGRLGSQLLGRRLRLLSRPTDLRKPKPPLTVEHDVAIDFGKFEQGSLLTDIQPLWTTSSDVNREWSGIRPWGTVLQIEDLWTSDVIARAEDELDAPAAETADEAAWIDEGVLTSRLSVLINPYRKVRKFDLAVSVDGSELDLIGVSRQVREAALGRWHVSYDRKVLHVRGLLRSEWFRPGDAERISRFQKEIARESGREELCRRIGARGPMSEYEIAPASGPWAVEVNRTIRIPDDLQGLPGGDPGPFEMEIDVVSLQLAVARDASLTIFNRQAEYRAWIKERANVNVYRDGFAVATGFDFLRLGQAFTGGGSFYGLRPQNVMGYVAVSGADNPQLEETTNREAFRRTPAFERFDALLIHARNVINRALDEAGRTAVEFARELQEEDQGLLGLTPDELVETTADLAARASSAASAITSVERVLTSISEAADTLGQQTAAEASQALVELKDARRVIAAAEQLAPIAANLRDRITGMETAYDELIATAGLGIAAEGLAHDLTAVIQRLSERAKQARPYAKNVPVQVELALDDVRWATGALRSQLRHLDPMLRHSRLRRESLDLGKVVGAQLDYHRHRLAGKGIVVHLHRVNPATVRLSPGRLGQALDNLMLNSEYWLGTEPPSGEARIDVTVDGHTVTVSDNGPGVDPKLGDAVFDAFVTRRHEGRGLGLWLTQQLLDSDGASISLRGNDGADRLHHFVIEYPTT